MELQSRGLSTKEALFGSILCPAEPGIPSREGLRFPDTRLCSFLYLLTPSSPLPVPGVLCLL